MRRTIGALAAIVTTFVVVLTGAVVGPAANGTTRYTSTVQNVVPGVTLTRTRDATGPVQIRSLKVDPASPVTVDSTLARGVFPGWARTSQMAAANGAVAAVNGDFGVENGRPLHSFANDGTLDETGVDAGDNFAISQNEQHTYFGPPTQTLTLTTPTTSFPIDHWNAGAPMWGEISGFSTVGGTVEHPPTDACSARLMPLGVPSWSGKTRASIVRSYTVNQVLCSHSPMPLNGGVVVSSRNGGAAAPKIRNLAVGATVSVAWSFGWPDVMDSIGGRPMLLQAGRVVAPTGCGYLCERQPRTGVGITADGKLLIVTVDGRQPGWSLGYTLVQFANEMRREGAVTALNLDGGGSTTMIVKGVKVNRPTDPSGERYVTSALLVLPGKDPGEPLYTTPHAPYQPADGSAPRLRVSEAAAKASWRAAKRDPGSTGGLLEAISGGALDGSSKLPPKLEHVAASFTAAQR
jgi:hypothetical protein